MIEKLDAESMMSSSPRDMAKKINELIEASNRQDRLLSVLAVQHPKTAGWITEEDRKFWVDTYENEVVRG